MSCTVYSKSLKALQWYWARICLVRVHSIINNKLDYNFDLARSKQSVQISKLIKVTSASHWSSARVGDDCVHWMLFYFELLLPRYFPEISGCPRLQADQQKSMICHQTAVISVSVASSGDAIPGETAGVQWIHGRVTLFLMTERKSCTETD